MVRLFVGLATLATLAFADIRYSCIGYRSPTNPNGAFGVSINGAITKLVANETTFPVWTGVVPGATSASEYTYVELDSAGAVLRTEPFTRKLNATTDTESYNEFFERPVTHHVYPRLPFTYLFTWPSKSKAFKEDQIATLHLTAPAATVNAMNAQPEEDHEVKVNFRFINAKNIYSQRNITLKTSGKSSKEFAKQSYKIKFDTDYNQTFFHRPNLKLRAMATEPTQMREKLYINMLNSVGIPTQQGSYVRLFINEEPYGLFLMVDDIKKSFLKQTVHSGDNKITPGSLIQMNAWKTQADLIFRGPTTASYDEFAYESQNLGTNPVTDPLAQLIKFMQALQDFNPVTTPNPVEYWTSRLELDGFLRNMALEYLMGGFDNYWMSGSNYFMYFNPTLGNGGKWQWIPTDFDGTFGAGASIDPAGSYKTLYNFTPDHPLVSKLIIQNPQIAAMFQQVLKEIISTAFKPEAMDPHIKGLNQMLSLDAKWDMSLVRKSTGKDHKFTFAEFNQNLVNKTREMSGALMPWVATRANAVATELAFTIPSGTADRVPPPPRPGGEGDEEDEVPEGGQADVKSAAGSLTVFSGMAMLAMLASSALLL